MLKEIAKPAALRKEVSEGVFSLPSAYQPQQRCEKEEVVKGEFAVLSKMVTFDASPLKSVACEKDRGGTRPGSGRGPNPFCHYFIVSPNVSLLPLLLNMQSFMMRLKVTSTHVLC